MKYVSIAKYSESFQANIAKSRLENAGIHCIINNENLINTVWLSSEVVGGLELLVFEDDAEKAKELLDVSFDIDENTEFVQEENGTGSNISNIFCPKCGSATVIQTDRPDFFSFFMNFLFFKKSDKIITLCECSKCGNKWKL